VEPEEMVPDADEPDGAVALVLSGRDGELVLRPVPLVPVPDVLGDADGV
jgi:hypothetical protein